MDLNFFLVSFVFLVFLILAYYLDVIKLSTPLILIYLIFCFSYLIDINKDISTSLNKPKEDERQLITIENIEETSDKNSDILKPIVSFNPKPIIIDSNPGFQKVKEKEDLDNMVDEEITANIDLITDEAQQNSLKLNEIMICRGVYKRNPIKPGFNFTNNVDSLFCYTKISNNGSKQEIRHLWYYDDKLITSVVYNVKTSYNYRSWSKKTILPNQTGKWRVEIVDSREKLLGSREFEIASVNNAF